MLTEKVGINAGSVDLSTEDEAMAALYELDTNTADYDEHPFTSTSYSLPVRVSRILTCLRTTHNGGKLGA